MIIPNMMGQIKFMFQTTNQLGMMEDGWFVEEIANNIHIIW